MLACRDFTFRSSAFANNTRWADLVDSDDEVSMRSSPKLTPTQIDSSERTICAGNRGVEDDCSTQASSECGDAPESSRTRWADVLSDDDEESAFALASKSSTRRAFTQQPRHDEGAGYSVSSSSQRPWKELAVQPSQQMQRSWKAAAWSSTISSKTKNVPSRAAYHRPVQVSFDGYARRPAAKAKNQIPKKLQCQFIIGIDEEPSFGAVRRVLGPHGKHVKVIVQRTGAKLRLRGLGSGFREGPEQQESSDPLMLCVSAQDAQSYELAKQLVSEHLANIYKQYRRVAMNANCNDVCNDLRIHLHEGPREGSF